MTTARLCVDCGQNPTPDARLPRCGHCHKIARATLGECASCAEPTSGGHTYCHPCWTGRKPEQQLTISTSSPGSREVVRIASRLGVPAAVVVNGELTLCRHPRDYDRATRAATNNTDNYTNNQ